MPGKLLSESAGHVRLHVHAQPGAKRNTIVGTHGDALKVVVTAPPVDGKANDSICALIAESFGLPASAVSVVSGLNSRRKTVVLNGLSLANAQLRLQELLSLHR